jgi:hypothetical protein
MCADRWTDFVPKVAEQREVCVASGGRRETDGPKRTPGDFTCNETLVETEDWSREQLFDVECCRTFGVRGVIY